MKRLAGLMTILFAAGLQLDARTGYHGRCLTPDGRPAANCLAGIRSFETGQQVRIFAGPGEQDAELVNPLVADSDGCFDFFTLEGVYEIRLTAGTPDVGQHRIEFVWLGSPESFPQPPARGENVFDIREFGATPDDATDDDLLSIQAAIDAAAAAGGGTVLIPAGVFDVAPAGSCAPCIEPRDRVSLVGTGPESIVRVRAHHRPFDAVFGEGGRRLQDVVFSNFTIDGNVAQNPGTVANAPGENAFLIRIYAGRRIWINNMWLHYSGTNAVTVNGTDVADVWLLENYAEYRPDHGAPPYDNTALYTNGYNVTVAYNTVVGEIVSGMPRVNGGAIGGIELHGGPALAVGNEIRETRVCLGIVSASGHQSDNRDANHIAAIGNTCQQVNEGIVVVSIDGQRLRNVAVAGNTIEVAQTQWDQHCSSGIELLWLSSTISGDLENIAITGNTIRFEDEGAGSARATAVLSNTGIGLAPAGNVANVTVAGNTVIGAPLMAMRIGNLLHTKSSYQGVTVANNLFVDYGQNRLANPYFRLGIRTEGDLRGLAIVSNEFQLSSNDDPPPAIAMVPRGPQNATSYEQCVVTQNRGAELSAVDGQCSTGTEPALVVSQRSRAAFSAFRKVRQ